MPELCTLPTEPFTEPPEYNPNARIFDKNLFKEMTVNELCPISPPPDSVVGTLSKEWVEKEDTCDLPPVATGRKGSISSSKGSGSVSSIPGKYYQEDCHEMSQLS